MSITIKNFQQKINLNPIEISIEDLLQLYKVLTEINSQAIDAETKYRIETKEFTLPDQKDNKENQPTEILMPFRIEIENASGKYVSGTSQDLLTKENIGSDVTSIKFDNIYFCNLANKYFPMRQFQITLDFSHRPIINLGKSSSLRTENSSEISVWGIDQIWVNGATKSIEDILLKNRINSELIHQSHIYDFILWLIFLPLVLLNIAHLDLKIKTYFNDKTGAFIGVVYLFTVGISILLFKFMFDYARWLFPYVSFKEFPRPHQTFNKVILTTLFLAVVGGLLTNIVWQWFQ